MAEFSVELRASDQNSDSTLTLPYRVLETPVAFRWFGCLKDVVMRGDRLVHSDRFYNFAGDPRLEKAAVTAEINQCIDIINSYHHGLITHRAFDEMDHIYLHELHEYFEKFRGPISKPAREYSEAPVDVQQAFNRLNVAIHRFEDLLHFKNRCPHFVADFENLQRHSLEPEDYQHFTLGKKFGTIYMDYCEVGKHFWEMTLVDDNKFEADKIRPQRFYAANFLAWFAETYSAEKTRHNYVMVQRWFERSQDALRQLGYSWEDGDLALGLIPVAELIMDNSQIAGQNSLVAQIAKHQCIAGVSLL